MASTSAKGAVELATNLENAANVVVQGNDSRFAPWIVTGSNKVYAAHGDGNPHAMLGISHTNLSPNTLTTSVARCIKFRLPVALSVTDVYVFSVAALSPAFSFAIYPVGTSTSKTWEAVDQNLSANSWLDMSVSFSLSANTDYWFCVATTQSSATNCLRCFNAAAMSTHANFYGADDVAPFGGLSAGVPTTTSFAVTSEASPAPCRAFPASQPAALSTLLRLNLESGVAVAPQPQGPESI